MPLTELWPLQRCLQLSCLFPQLSLQRSRRPVTVPHSAYRTLFQALIGISLRSLLRVDYNLTHLLLCGRVPTCIKALEALTGCCASQSTWGSGTYQFPPAGSVRARVPSLTRLVFSSLSSYFHGGGIPLPSILRGCRLYDQLHQTFC